MQRKKDFSEGGNKMDRQTNNILKLMKELGTDFEIPDELAYEKPDEEIIHEWSEFEEGGHSYEA